MISLEPRELARAVNRAGFFATLVDVDGRRRGAPHAAARGAVPSGHRSRRCMSISCGSAPARKVTVSVPVHFINQDRAPGLRRGGILNIVRHDIELICPRRRHSRPAGRRPGRARDRRQRPHRRGDDARRGAAGDWPTRDFTIASIAASSAVREEAIAAATAAQAPAEADGRGGRCAGGYARRKPSSRR